MPVRRRLDVELVRRGLATSRGQARDLVDAGRVTVAGGPALKAGRLVGTHEPVALTAEAPRHVSRAGEKLHGALERFDVATAGARALDAGASTGGFTDCLLHHHGVAHVTAVDVGYGHLHETLRRDPRVEVRERTNLRLLDPGDLGSPFSPVVADLSFISLRLVLPVLLGAAAPGGDLVVLVKPQFEAGREAADRGRGVIRDPQVWQEVLVTVGGALQEGGAAVVAGMPSPVQGASGNVEFLLHARTPGHDALGGPGAGVDVGGLAGELVAAAGAGVG